MSRPHLAAQLRRQVRLFARFRCGRVPSRLALLGHELAARRGLDLFAAVLFLVPGLGPLLRRRLRDRVCCAFLGFTDAAETRAGCLLHPARWGGADRRREAAFALLPGYGCDEPGYFCEPAARYATAPVAERRRFRNEAGGADWFDYSRAVERLGESVCLERDKTWGR